jgi:cell division septation protein DedD
MPLKITGSIPDPNSTKLYQIQVGAFKIYSNAQRLFERLTNSSFNPVYEKYQDFTRVIIPGVNAKDISNYLERLKRMGFQEVFIKEDR